MRAAILAAALFSVSDATQKILCLHGGGGNAPGFAASWGMTSLEAALPNFEFVYASAAYPGGLWIPDPPGGKDEPTTDPNFAANSVATLDDIVAEQGPFYGILGYSQGAAFTIVYVAHAPVGTFQIAMVFCGYLTTTHLGILSTVNSQSPFGNIPALIWIGAQDDLIVPSMSIAAAEKFTSPAIVTSQAGGHAVPGSSDQTFGQVVAFVTDNLITTVTTTTTFQEECFDKIQNARRRFNSHDCAKKTRLCPVAQSSRRRFAGFIVKKFCPATCEFCSPDGRRLAKLVYTEDEGRTLNEGGESIDGDIFV